MRAAKEAGLNVAVETTGNVPRATMEAMEPYVDHFLFDFKHSDDKTLASITGADGLLIKGNLSWLLELCPQKVNVRIPVIPSFNFEADTLAGMLEQLREWGCQKVNLLPYHVLGKAKYERMGLGYSCPERSLDEDALLPFHCRALELGMESRIGA